MRLRRLAAPLLGLVLTAGALAGCTAATDGGADSHPASATPTPSASADATGSKDGAGTKDPTKPTEDRGRIFQFRLPSLEGRDGDPNALNVARHGPPGAPLLLFLPATRAEPQDYREFLDTASDAGFSVLGLDYWNIGKSLTVTCGPDAACYDRFQRNRFDGTHPSRFSRVDAANSILSRLKESLTYLDDHDRHGDWGRFLTENENGILWSDIVVAGHSQGGGESAFISHYHRVKGVLMFSSPVETFQDVSAEWMEKPGKTPPLDMYGFDLTTDVYTDRIVPSWAKIGMGQADPAAATAVPTGSHTLLSDREVGTPFEAHGRSISDGGPRRKDGTPLFRPTWEWMLEQVK